MAFQMRMWMGAMLAGALAAPVSATAASCGGVTLDPRFHEAVALCGGGDLPMSATASGTAPVALAAPVAAATEPPAPDTSTAPPDTSAARSVSIAMPGTRAPWRGRSAVRRPAAGPSPIVAAVSRRYRIDPHLFASMMRQESGGRQDAVSRKGALGLMQVMPATARSVGVADPRAMLGNPVLAMSAGAVYLKRLQARFGNDVPLVLAAYNAGPGAVMKAGRRIPKYRETQGYVGAIMQRWQRARQGR